MSKEEENQLLKQHLQQCLSDRDHALEERERKLRRVSQQLETSKQVVAQFERQIAELEQQLHQREQPNLEGSVGEIKPAKIILRWREGKRAPCKMWRRNDAVVDSSTMYVRDQDSQVIQLYDITSGIWSQLQLPGCIRHSPIVIVNGWLTAVGGYKSNELFSLTKKGSGRRWTKKFPPMPTKRHWTTALCTETMLIVVGGAGVD